MHGSRRAAPPQPWCAAGPGWWGGCLHPPAPHMAALVAGKPSDALCLLACWNNCCRHLQWCWRARVTKESCLPCLPGLVVHRPPASPLPPQRWNCLPTYSAGPFWSCFTIALSQYVHEGLRLRTFKETRDRLSPAACISQWLTRWVAFLETRASNYL